MTGSTSSRRATGAILSLALLALGALGGGMHAAAGGDGLIHDVAGHEVHEQALVGADGESCTIPGLHVEGSRPAPHRDCPVCFHARALRVVLANARAMGAARLPRAAVALPAVSAGPRLTLCGAGPRAPPLA